ncbi:MAG: NAD(P)H-dependent oxidoreductase subunit E [Spirochaetia bacterium]|nr:NAD(P)H-dependent oxidoreductase subunit E [Spirochaetia bacterium]
MTRTFSAAAAAELKTILDDFPNKKSALLMVLRLVEREFGMIDDGGMELTAATCEVSVAHVLGMVSFYTHFKRPFHGKHRFMVCATLMCSIGGPNGRCDQSLAVIQRKLGISPGECTFDGLFSVEKVECLADCNRPPVIQKDNDHHVNMTDSLLEELIDSLLTKEGKSAVDYSSQKGTPMNARIPSISVKQSVPRP